MSTPSSEPVVLSLGSNMGDSMATLQGAVDALGRVPGLTLTPFPRSTAPRPGAGWSRTTS